MSLLFRWFRHFSHPMEPPLRVMIIEDEVRRTDALCMQARCECRYLEARLNRIVSLSDNSSPLPAFPGTC